MKTEMFDNIDTGFKKPMAAPSVNEARTVQFGWGCLLFMSRQEVTSYEHTVIDENGEYRLWELSPKDYEQARSRVLSNGIPIINANARREHIVIIKRALKAKKPVPEWTLEQYTSKFYVQDWEEEE